MDYLPVSHNKKEFETESGEYKDVVILLTQEFKEIVRRARETSLASKVTEVIKNETEAWKGAIVESFHKELKDLVDLPPRRKRSANEGDPVGEVVIEKRDPRLQDSIRRAIEKGERTRSPRDKKQVIVTHFITIAGKKYLVNHIYAQLGENSGWKEYEYLKEKGTIEVVTNQDFPAYAITGDIGFYAAIHIAESLAEIIGEINGFDVKKVGEIKETLLRRAAKILDQFREQLNIAN